ncbi:MAG: Ig-like domain-containing protein [Candidatus Hodarchaeota archaeon]
MKKNTIIRIFLAFLLLFSVIFFISPLILKNSDQNFTIQDDSYIADDSYKTNLKTSSSSWINATVVSDGFAGSYWNNETSTFPDIAMDSKDIVHMVWQDDTDGVWGSDIEIMYANYSAATGQLSNATVISDGFAGSYWNNDTSKVPKIAVDSSDNLHVIWEDDTDGVWGNDWEIMYANYTAATGQWSNATVISDGFEGSYWNNDSSASVPFGVGADIAVDSKDIVHVVWNDDTDGVWGNDWEIMYVNYSASQGWSNATVISDGFEGSYWNTGLSGNPSIAVDGSDNLHVVWDDTTDGVWRADDKDADIWYVNYTAATGQWSNATLISDGFGGSYWNTGNSIWAEIVVDSMDNIYVVWADGTDGPWRSVLFDSEIWCVNYSAATGQWSNATLISDGHAGIYWNTFISWYSEIAVDSMDNIYVVWADASPEVWGNDGDILCVNYSAATGQWSNVTVISDGFAGSYWNDGTSWYPAITIDSRDNIHVIWEDGTDGVWGTDIEIMYVMADLTAPNVTIGTPLSGSSFTNTMDIDINATITDLETSVLSAKALINASTPLEIPMEFIANNWTCTWDNVSLYEAGDYNITIWAIDEQGNVNQSVFVIITITDIIAPSVTIGTPLDGSSFEPPTDTSVEINATITDLGSSVSSAKAMINGSATSNPFNLTMEFIASNWTCGWNNISLSDYAHGDYKITIWATDDKGNVNQTVFVVIKLIKDLDPPLINFLSPLNESTVTGPFNITVEIIDASQPAAVNVIATIYNDTITPFNLTMVRIGATNQWTVMWENLTSAYNFGEYYINITAIDGSYYQNRNSTGYLNITYIASDQPLGDDDDDDDDDDEEFNLLTPTNLMILGIIVGVTLGIILIIRKRKGYKSSDKKIREIQELIEK